MPLERSWLLTHLPHGGSMCLLDAVLDWSTSGITCRTAAHRDRANPLRTDNRLHALCAIELAAQAVAAHGALISPEHTGRRGMLASARDVALHVERLDDIAGDLEVRAERIGGDAGGLLYHFDVSGPIRLISGRLAIAFQPTAET